MNQDNNITLDHVESFVEMLTVATPATQSYLLNQS